MRKLMIVAVLIAAFTACKKSEDKKPDPAPATDLAPKPTEGTAAEPPKPADPGAPATPTETKPDDTAAAAGARPATVTDAHVAVADKLVGLMQDFGKALETAGTDCKAATAAIKAFTPKLEAIATEAEKVKAETDADPAAKEWFEKTYAPKMMGAMGPMMQTAQACQSDKDFTAAMQSMQMPGRKVKKQ